MHTWDVCVVADKVRWLGRVDAEDETSAIAGGAKQFSKDPKKLILCLPLENTARVTLHSPVERILSTDK